MFVEVHDFYNRRRLRLVSPSAGSGFPTPRPRGMNGRARFLVNEPPRDALAPPRSGGALPLRAPFAGMKRQAAPAACTPHYCVVIGRNLASSLPERSNLLRRIARIRY
jgi:hypothetical protein